MDILNPPKKRWKYKKIDWICPDCGKSRKIRFGCQNRPGFTGRCLKCGLKYRGLNHRGINNSKWKGGKLRATYGYIYIHIDKSHPFYSMAQNNPKRKTTWGCYILEHRLVMAEKLNRALKSNEVVHHLNGIRDDNRLENLALVKEGQTHEGWTLVKQLQKRIRELEGK